MPALSRVPRGAAFWVVGAVLLALMFAAGAPSPLYVVYQAQWHFSATVLTTVFAVYAVFLLLALLTVGSLSDFLGRRRVLIASVLLEAASMLLFVGADGVGWLFAARAVQGAATGAATGAVAAALIDLAPPQNPRLGSLVNGAAATTGLAFGALGSGLLVQYAPAPTTLVFVLLAVVFVAAAGALALIPETVAARPGALASLRPRMRVPRRSRMAFAALVPCLVAVWALCGLYLSLGPSLAAGVLGVRSHLVGGVVVAVATGMATLGSLTNRGRGVRPVIVTGTALLALGVALTLLALGARSVPLFFAGTAIGGYGFGTAFLGSLTAMAGLAGPEERAELFAAVYVVNYLAFGVPAVIAGFAVPRFGLEATAVVYGGVVVLLSLAALLFAAVRREPERAARVLGGARNCAADPAVR